jgi:hypothetical protein
VGVVDSVGNAEGCEVSDDVGTVVGNGTSQALQDLIHALSKSLAQNNDPKRSMLSSQTESERTFWQNESRVGVSEGTNDGKPVGEAVVEGVAASDSVGTGVGSTVGTSVIMIISSLSTATVASAPTILFEKASVAISAANSLLFTTTSSISLVVSALRENSTSIPVAFCSCTEIFSPTLASSTVMLPANESLAIPAAIPLVSEDTVSIVTGISKLLPSNLRRRELEMIGVPKMILNALSEGNSDRYAAISDALYSGVRVPSLSPSIVSVWKILTCTTFVHNQVKKMLRACVVGMGGGREREREREITLHMTLPQCSRVRFL